MADLETLLVATLKRYLAGQPAELTAGLAPLWAAFCDLSATRPATPAGTVRGHLCNYIAPDPLTRESAA